MRREAALCGKLRASAWGSLRDSVHSRGEAKVLSQGELQMTGFFKLISLFIDPPNVQRVLTLIDIVLWSVGT